MPPARTRALSRAQMGKRGQTVIREQKRSVVGYRLLGAGEAERRVAAAIPCKFSNRHFLDAGRLKDIHPLAGTNDPHPERTVLLVHRTAEVLRLHNGVGGLSYQELLDRRGLPSTAT